MGMHICFIRHGQSEGNLRDEINDDPARVVNLTARGRSQAEVAAERLRGTRFTHAYASQFARAQQTAEIILRGRSLALGVDARLNERRSGMDGQHVERFNGLVRSDPLQAKPPHGESFIEQMARLKSFLEEIAVRHPRGTVLAVSHENPILAAVALTVADPETVVRGSLENCEVVELIWSAACRMESPERSAK